MKKTKEFLKESFPNVTGKEYGSGNVELSWISASVICFVSVLLSGVMFIVTKDQNISEQPLVILCWYLAIVFSLLGFFVFALFLCEKKQPEKDRFKVIKIVFYYIMAGVFLLSLIPFVVLRAIIDGLVILIGKVLRIIKLLQNPMVALGMVAVWLFLAVGFIFIFYTLILYFFQPYLLNANKTASYFSVFFALFLSNIIAKKGYIYFAKIPKEERNDSDFNNQFDLFWTYIVLVLSFVLKALDFEKNTQLLFDALFYSTMVLTLCYKVRDLRKKAILRSENNKG